MKAKFGPVGLAMTAILSWSTVATAFKISLRHVSVYEMALIAAFTALIIYTLWLTATGGWKDIKKLTPALWIKFALLGFVNPATYYLVMFRAYDYAPAQIAQPVNYIWPIILALMLSVVHRTPIPGLKYFGMFVSLAGVALISFGGKGISGQIPWEGLSYAAMSAFLWAIYWMLNDKLKGVVKEIPSLFLTFLFGFFYLAVGTIVVPVSFDSMPGVAASVYIGIFEMGIPFIFFGMAIRRSNNPALINQLSFLAPFLSLFFISMILNEPIMPTTYIGLALIIGGLIFNQYISERKRPHGQRAIEPQK